MVRFGVGALVAQCLVGTAEIAMATQAGLGLVVSGRVFPALILKDQSNLQLQGLAFTGFTTSPSSNQSVLDYGPLRVWFEQTGMTTLAFNFKLPSHCTVGGEPLSDVAVGLVYNDLELDPNSSVQVPLDLIIQTFVVRIASTLGAEISGAQVSCEPGELIYSY